MEDNLNLFFKWKTISFYFVNGRQPQFIFQMEDDLNLFCKMKMLSIYFVNGRQPNYFAMEEDLLFFENGRLSHFCCKWKTTSFPL